MSKQTVVFDFDGVVHRYSKGWQDGSIYDIPNEGIKETINRLRLNNYEVVIVSTRCNTEEGRMAILTWLFSYGIVVDKVCKEKPPAIVYIDDRAICYDPDMNNLYDRIINFKTQQTLQQNYEKLNDLELLGLLTIKTKQFEQLNKEIENKYPAKDNPIVSIKILDGWIESLQKYL